MPSFSTAYIAAALSSSLDDKGQPLDRNHSPASLSPSTVAKMRDDCVIFQRENANDLEGLDDCRAGSDFWLTRNRHGFGFWDNDNYDSGVGRRLTEAAHAHGEASLYVGDDGRIYGG